MNESGRFDGLFLVQTARGVGVGGARDARVRGRRGTPTRALGEETAPIPDPRARVPDRVEKSRIRAAREGARPLPRVPRRHGSRATLAEQAPLAGHVGRGGAGRVRVGPGAHLLVLGVQGLMTVGHLARHHLIVIQSLADDGQGLVDVDGARAEARAAHRVCLPVRPGGIYPNPREFGSPRVSARGGVRRVRARSRSVSRASTVFFPRLATAIALAPVRCARARDHAPSQAF